MHIPAPPSDLSLGLDSKYALSVVRRFPAIVHETLIWYWRSWDLVEPQ